MVTLRANKLERVGRTPGRVFDMTIDQVVDFDNQLVNVAISDPYSDQINMIKQLNRVDRTVFFKSILLTKKKFKNFFNNKVRRCK